MARLTGRSQRKAATADRLVRAAYRRFSRHGITATRIHDIAVTASVAHGTAFLHFPTRDQLVAAVIKKYAGSIALRLHERVGAGAGLREVLELHLEGLREHESFYAHLIMEGRVLGAVARTTVIAINSAISLHLSVAVQREMDSGRMRVVNAAFLFNLWIGLVHHYLLNRDLFAPGASVLERCGKSMIDQLMNLVSITPKEKVQ